MKTGIDKEWIFEIIEKTNRFQKQLIEDHFELHPETSKEVFKILNDVYGALWMEAYYDPDSESSAKFAKPLAEKMKRLNELLKFKK